MEKAVGAIVDDDHVFDRDIPSVSSESTPSSPSSADSILSTQHNERRVAKSSAKTGTGGSAKKNKETRCTARFTHIPAHARISTFGFRVLYSTHLHLTHQTLRARALHRLWVNDVMPIQSVTVGFAVPGMFRARCCFRQH